jgi:uncharacterized protein
MLGCPAVEIQVEFGKGLRGILHKAKSGRAPAVCLLHGFTGNKVEEGRLFVRAARAFAAAGIHALRFDFRGSGDSDGEFGEMTLQTEVEDARAALAFLRKTRGVDKSRLAIVGLSLGSVVGQIVATREGVTSLVLWATITRPAEIFDQEMEFSAIFRGYEAGPEFLRQIRESEPLMMLARYQGSLLCVHGEEDFVPVEQARAALATRTGILHVLSNGDHTFGTYKTKAEAIDVTRRFLEATLRPDVVSAANRSGAKKAKASKPSKRPGASSPRTA